MGIFSYGRRAFLLLLPVINYIVGSDQGSCCSTAIEGVPHYLEVREQKPPGAVLLSTLYTLSILYLIKVPQRGATLFF